MYLCPQRNTHRSLFLTAPGPLWSHFSALGQPCQCCCYFFLSFAITYLLIIIIKIKIKIKTLELQLLPSLRNSSLCALPLQDSWVFAVSRVQELAGCRRTPLSGSWDKGCSLWSARGQLPIPPRPCSMGKPIWSACWRVPTSAFNCIKYSYFLCKKFSISASLH